MNYMPVLHFSAVAVVTIYEITEARFNKAM